MDCCIINEPKCRFLGQESWNGLAGSSGSTCSQIIVKVFPGNAVIYGFKARKGEKSTPNVIHEAVGEL